MNYAPNLNKIVLLGNYPPRQCGIATFTQDVYKAITHNSDVSCLVFSVSDQPEGYETPDEVVLELRQNELADYKSAADYAESVGAQLICVQHEFGIYGGPAGMHLITFMERVNVPIVVQLHTILEEPNREQRAVMDRMKELVSRFIVMSKRGKKMLQQIYDIDPHLIDVIPHGIPDTPYADPSFFKDMFGLEGRKMLLTFGLLSPNKGIEEMIRALPAIVKRHPDTTYVILGATHPHIIRDRGEEYRSSLIALADELGVRDHVHFESRFVELEELIQYISACDVYITPYLNKQQITSGTLSYAYGSGNAVVSTPYWHAEELLKDDRGSLVPFNNPEALADAVCMYLDDDVLRNRTRKAAYLEGRGFVWPKIGARIRKAFRNAIPVQTETMHGIELTSSPLPTVTLEHLRRLTDGVGLFQHARYRFPSYQEGYCTDDNARALMVAIQVVKDKRHPVVDDVESLANRYAAFMDYAWNEEAEGFRNFMGFNREWLEESGSADCYGRCIHALGYCTAQAPWPELRLWASEFYNHTLPGLLKLDSIRAWANALLGIHCFRQRFPGHKLSIAIARELAERMRNCYELSHRPDWLWFEENLTYDNARLSEAMLVAGEMLGDEEYTSIGLQSLEWLMEEQVSEGGCFRPIGSNGFYTRGGIRAIFDQQPLEAWAAVAACRAAYQITGANDWRSQGAQAFAWFMGDNDLNIPVADPEAGACHDGLHAERINHNCGAESTLAYLGAVCEMRRFSSLKTPILAAN